MRNAEFEIRNAEFGINVAFLQMVEKHLYKIFFERSEKNFLNVLRSKIFHVDKVNISYAEGVYH